MPKKAVVAYSQILHCHFFVGTDGKSASIASFPKEIWTQDLLKEKKKQDRSLLERHVQTYGV
jgi:hypothetical protein